MMFAISQNLEKKAELLAKREEIRARTKELYEQEYEQFQGRYTNRENLRLRNDLFCKLFAEVLN